jgi:glycosyltransferase involved in cell wall biosynthesis
LVHFTSGYTLSASVINLVKRLGYPLLVTLTDFWFLCPRVTLRRWDGTICDGRTTAWECLRCLLGDARVYRWPAAVLPEPLLALALTAASERPAISRQRGLRGRALDMAQRKALLMPALERADVIIAPSHFLAEVYTAAGLKAKIRIMPYGHDLGWTRHLPGRGPASARLRVGYVGRMTEDKGVHVLLQAVREAGCKENLDVHLYGGLDQEPVYGQHLLALAAGLGGVTWHNRFSREQLAEVYSQLDVLVVPSLWHENNPLVIQEAFAAGVPVIASRMGGMAEFVTHGVNGLLFEAGSATDLAEALCLLAEQPALVEKMRANLPAVRTIEQEADDLQALYESTIQQVFAA